MDSALCQRIFMGFGKFGFQFFDPFAERRFCFLDAVLADFHGYLILAACARFPRVRLIAETRTAGSTKHFKFNVKRGHNNRTSTDGLVALCKEWIVRSWNQWSLPKEVVGAQWMDEQGVRRQPAVRREFDFPCG